MLLELKPLVDNCLAESKTNFVFLILYSFLWITKQSINWQLKNISDNPRAFSKGAQNSLSNEVKLNIDSYIEKSKEELAKLK
jgi:hypothetical protein